MDAGEFENKTGYPPIVDDLERVNCPNVGTIGHQQCGWCLACGMGRFMCGHFAPLRKD